MDEKCKIFLRAFECLIILPLICASRVFQTGSFSSSIQEAASAFSKFRETGQKEGLEADFKVFTITPGVQVQTHANLSLLFRCLLALQKDVDG